jgi:Cu+-exporting ATPase
VSQDVHYDFSVSGMTCAACAARLEKVLNRLPGVEAQRQFRRRDRAGARHRRASTEPAAIVAAVAKAGFAATPRRPVATGRPSKRPQGSRGPLPSCACSGCRPRSACPYWSRWSACWAPDMAGSAHHDGSAAALAAVRCWPRPCSSGSGGVSTQAPGRPCAGGGANMDVLVALGTSVAYFFSHGRGRRSNATTCMCISRPRPAS